MKNRKHLWVAVGLLMAFLLWTGAVCCLDVAAIGPRNSAVGLATLNQFIHRLTGVHMTLYTVTDWLGLVPLGVAFGFAMLGLVQWIKRRRLRLVDYSILVLGGFYVAVMAAYLLFESVTVNYRPILINGYLETSYPSSTTMLALCVMPTAAMQLCCRLRRQSLRRAVSWCIGAFTAFMVVGRLLSGVHWFSDIVGGILLSGGLVMLYVFAIQRKE